MSATPVTLTEDEWRRLKAPARRERIFRLVSYFSPLLLLLLWELSSQINLIDRRFFPAPSAIAGTAWRMLVTFELFDHIGATLRRVGIGYAMGAVPGIVMGLILGLSRPVRRVLGPIFAALYP
ncbi:ABC transporter permease, partial [Rhizobiaceae sp. 2RAB30]